MKRISVLLSAIVLSSVCFADSPAAPPPMPSPAPAAQAVQPSPKADAGIQIQPPQTVAVPQDEAPPAWATELLSSVSKLPVIGPMISKALMYLGVLSALLTALVAFLNAAAIALKSVVGWAGLTNLIAQIESFQQSKIMYWLTAMSSIPTHITPAQAGAPGEKKT